MIRGDRVAFAHGGFLVTSIGGSIGVVAIALDRGDPALCAILVGLTAVSWIMWRVSAT